MAERSNLWVFDERLSFGDEILSDVPIDVTDAKSSAPDLVIYDSSCFGLGRPLSIPATLWCSSSKNPEGPITVLGSKRDPVAQLQDEVFRLREGSD